MDPNLYLYSNPFSDDEDASSNMESWVNRTTPIKARMEEVLAVVIEEIAEFLMAWVTKEQERKRRFPNLTDRPSFSFRYAFVAQQ